MYFWLTYSANYEQKFLFVDKGRLGLYGRENIGMQLFRGDRFSHLRRNSVELYVVVDALGTAIDPVRLEVMALEQLGRLPAVTKRRSSC